MSRSRRWRATMAAAAVAIGSAVWFCRDQAPYPYSQRVLLNIPLPWLTNRSLRRVLALRGHETVVEIGPGTGLQSVAVASWLADHGGRLIVIDIQDAMLKHVTARTRRRRLDVVAVQADALRLPLAEASVDVAYAITAIGETGDVAAALAELERTLAPNGRIVVGEFTFDRHGVRFGTLARAAHRAKLHVSRRSGNRLAYTAELRRPFRTDPR